MKRFRLIDNILGWLAFAIAAVVYCSTIEPTASFWDCPEFITTGYKMEIGHPPGAPFFMLVANLFSQFASDPTQVARMVNTMSALLSATCILFLFWSITHLVRRLLTSRGEAISTARLVAIEASGMVGALIYTFSDTFWYSAVEGEVYAFSSAFTAVVFWLILKWEDHADEPHADRWLVLIFYMTGLSIGVHLLNLLCLPAIVLVYYYRRVPQANLRGSIVALVISSVLLAAVLYGVVPGIITVGGWFELFFVNTLGCPFNTGEYIYLLLLVATVLWAIYETQNATDHNLKRQNIASLAAVGMLGIPFYGYGWAAFITGVVVLAVLWFVLNWSVGKGKEAHALITPRIKNTALLCMLMLMVGYSTYAITVIRSSANPPMDQNSPEDIFTLGDYLSRDQYGSRPLLYGQAYTSQVALERDGNYCRPVYEKGKPVYQRREKASENDPDEYFVVRTKDEYKYAQNMFFPRMYSASHAQYYENWMGGVDGREESYDRCGENIMVKVPSQWDNLSFFVSYQCNWMYWRYFLWNFAGRQNDIQGHGSPEKGNWLSGIPFIDNARLGNQDALPDELKQNKGHNVFYCLPLLLGLLGLFWQVSYGEQRKRHDSKQQKKKHAWLTAPLTIGAQQFWVVFFLFFMTGLAIVVYLNQTPMQPRERDYAYAGSFYAFAIWCGMGVAAIIDWLQRNALKRESLAAATVIAVAALAVPVQMVSQTWDDHDRSGRYTCRDFGQNYLMSLQQSATDENGQEHPSYPIIYTNGDNDTFPLWYNQDTEGVRTDARVCNLSYLQTDWYIDQMVRPAYDSPALPITWKRIEYCAGTNEYVQIDPRMKSELLQLYREHPDEARAHFGDEPFELKNILDHWVRSTDKDLHVIPTDTVYVTIDKEAVRRSGMMMAADSIPDRMVISLANKSALYKGDLMMLEMIANANWTRPIYVATTVGQENYMNLGDNFVQEGLVNRITPFTTKTAGAKNFDTKKTYENVTKRFRWGNVSQEGIYLDETVMRMCYTHRRLLATLALHLAAEGDTAKCAEVLALSEKELPTSNVTADYASGSLDMARAYAYIGDTVHARQQVEMLWNKSKQYLSYYNQLPSKWFLQSQQECALHLYIMQHVAEIAASIDEKLYRSYAGELNQIAQQYEQRGGIY
ncbi:MAG: DUF2723 domain-containing protein [Prevotella sp.]|nr:DUF2723 domain-containing protein [Prevotella sp.]